MKEVLLVDVKLNGGEEVAVGVLEVHYSRVEVSELSFEEVSEKDSEVAEFEVGVVALVLGALPAALPL